MKAGVKAGVKGRLSERRNRRSGCLADALRLQLETCREQEGLAAIVVSDELGFCVAHSGGDGDHAELAAQLPMLADPARHQWHGGETTSDVASGSLAITTFPIAGGRLHACAVGAPEATVNGNAVLERVARGFTRLLAE